MNNFYNPYFSQNNSFLGYYVSDYNEVLNMAVPSNGEAVVFTDLNQGMMYSKKIVNGIPYIQKYKISPIYQEVQKAETNDNSDILAELRAMRAELDELKGGRYDESNVKSIDGTIKKSES